MMRFTWYVPYEPKRLALISQLGLRITTEWDAIKNHLDCELLRDGTTRAELKQRLRPFEPYGWRDFSIQEDFLDGDVWIWFEDLPIEDRYYTFRDGKIIDRSYISGLDIITIECAK
jgi:hypothetical protein